MKPVLPLSCATGRKEQYITYIQKWASTRENLSWGGGGVETTKAQTNPAHLHSLISAFFIRLLESIISKFTTSEISIF